MASYIPATMWVDPIGWPYNWDEPEIDGLVMQTALGIPSADWVPMYAGLALGTAQVEEAVGV